MNPVDTKNKLARSLSHEELSAFLAELAATPGVDGPTIQRLAREKFEIEIGHNSAAHFKKEVFGAYLETMRKQAEAAKFIAEHVDPDDAGRFGAAISQFIGSTIFDELATSGLVIDVTTPLGIKQANAIATIAERLSRTDVRTAKLRKEAAEEAERKAKAEVAEAIEKRKDKGGGLSAEAVRQIEDALGWRRGTETEEQQENQSQ